ncbi:MAG TPA: hypothetical protein VFD55_01445 [Candidatus Angelobacter sp.]|nr:hypothetical protein [Candidatus Angelobacter sp.]
MDDELFLNEQIKVVAIFADGLNPCRPLKFKRASGREIVVTEIGLRHPSMQGKRMLHVFDVTDGMADYRIELDAERLVWRLTREADHGI